MFVKSSPRFYKIYECIATGVYVGYTPIVPGTVASLVTIPLYLILNQLPGIAYLAIIILLFLVGVKATNEVERVIGQQDPSIVVVDEIVGYLIALFLLPKTFWVIVGGFFVFRLFDIFKPFGIRKVDRNPKLGGFGVMADDALAGIYSNLTLWVIYYLSVVRYE